jgi:DNA-binding ferritin-like protein (Dps family)
MEMDLVEKIVGRIADKRRWRAYQARVRALPPDHRATVEALERYLLSLGAVHEGDVLLRMVEDLVQRFERAAADAVPVRSVVGEDPVQFAETFVRAYSHTHWNDGEHRRLTRAVERAAGGGAGEGTGGTGDDEASR